MVENIKKLEIAHIARDIREKIEILYEVIKQQWNGVKAYLKSKEIPNDFIVEFYNFGDWIEAKVRSRSKDEEHEVFICLRKDVYMCDCNAWNYKRYEIVIPPELLAKRIFYKKTIAVCPHILKVIECVYNIIKKFG